MIPSVAAPPLQYNAIALFLGILLLGNSAFGQTTVYVDSSATNSAATGDFSDPYASLSYAIQQKLAVLTPGSVIKVAGNGSLIQYTDDPGVNGWQEEQFPIAIPHGVRVDHWDKNNLLPHQRPPTAVFSRGDSAASDCFQFFGGSSSLPQGISGYLLTIPQPIPNLNQGIEVRDFEVAYRIQESQFTQIGVLEVVLDGVSAYECQQSVVIAVTYVSADITVKRSVFRSPSGGNFQPNEPVVEMLFDTGSDSLSQSPKVLFVNVDMRPQGADLQSSMMTIENRGGTQDYLTFTLKNAHISGQPWVQPIPPNPVNKIKGACIENLWFGDARGRTSIQNAVLWDAEGDGVLAFIRGANSAVAEIEILSSDVAYNGGTNALAQPVLAGSSPIAFSGSGIHLAALEKGNWQDVEFRETEARDNYKHGAYLELGSFADEHDGFQNVDVDYCNFSRNGLSLDPSEEGQGLFVRLHEAEINLEMHRSLLSRNHTTGLKFFLESGDTARAHEIAVTNVVISANEGKAGPDPGQYPNRDNLPRHISPLTVMAENQTHYATLNLSHVTFTDCAAPYAVSVHQMDDPTLGEVILLWSTSSSVDNSVLNKNHWNNGGFTENQAYYPEPPDPNQLPATHLWLRMFGATSYSNLGKDQPLHFVMYTATQGNFYSDPALIVFTWMNTLLGNVFQGAGSPVIGAGGGTVFAPENTDVRGLNYPRVVAQRDVGAFEVN